LQTFGQTEDGSGVKIRYKLVQSAATLAAGSPAVVLTPEQKQQRDKLLAEADQKLRQGLKDLAKTFPQLAVANNKPLAEALNDHGSVPGRLSLKVIWCHGAR
jgi:alkylhydroperoxidase/carboxymuconolactone decarboxylase family protein YurZ